MLHSVPRGFSKEQPGLSCTPGPAAAPGIRRATRAVANVCTAGSNLVLLNLAPLNSPLLRQGQDEANRLSCIGATTVCFSPSCVLGQLRHDCARGQGFGLPRPKRAPQPKWPCLAQNPPKTRARTRLWEPGLPASGTG